ncbi:MAG: hypothetical protein FJ290_21040 [Planctomycetes bacterium]|nr:hypothetical protein [Planctomycetota bacterium]
MARIATCLLALALPCSAASVAPTHNFRALRAAIQDLAATFGPKYPKAADYLARLDEIERTGKGDFTALQREALLANPLLDGLQLLVVKRRCKPNDPGFPTNHECNASLKRTGWDNEIAILSAVRPDAELRTLYRPDDGGYVGEVDLHWGATRLLFAKSDKANWKVWEVRADGSGLRQVSRAPDDVDCFDPCYLPNGQVIFGSTAAFQGVPCWHGRKRMTNLYVMNADGSGVRQLCFDQDHDFHPCVLPDGQVVYHRWDYTGISHVFLRQLMVMNPDGSGQRAIYGSNSWFPNSLYFPRPLPNRPGRLVCILSGYHGVNRMGQLVVVDTAAGSYEDDGLVLRISGRGEPIRRLIKDNLVDDDWPKFLHPFPLSDRHFLVSCWMGGASQWGIYLADAFDNLALVREEPGHALLEPVPLIKRPTPPAVADRVDLSRKDGVVYLHDVHAGPGLKGVPRGTIRSLRVLSYHFGYPDLAGPDLIGYGGPWEVMRIEGTVALDADGSAVFRAPANIPLAVQALDPEGKAVQLMRSWFTLMPGEAVSCIGCHERVADALPPGVVGAAKRPPDEIRPWHGPPRGFSFEREVQPVLDAHCVRCHNGDAKAMPDLRPLRDRKDYQGKRISELGVARMHYAMKTATKGLIRYTPAYDALLPYIRRVSIEDDVSLLAPGEYHADTSELVQLLRAGHQGVALDPEAWDRLVTWIDLNAPCHGTWGEVHPFPTNSHQRRMELRRLHAGPTEDPEAIPKAASYKPQAASGEPRATSRERPTLPGWPFDAAEAKRRQAALGATEKAIDLGGGISLTLVRVPAGEFLMGELAPARVRIERPFWMGKCEATNEQFRRFDPAFDPGYYAKLHARSDDQGLPLNGPRQPAVRVSWDHAMAFCRWLSQKTGLAFALPTEAQWEWACRAGTDSPLFYGGLDADFSRWANVGDRAYAAVKNDTGGIEHLDPAGRALCDTRFDDGAAATAPVGSYQPNPWGLHDMHGNAAEWTLSRDPSDPSDPSDRPNGAGNAPSEHAGRGTRHVVRGGSFYDRPARCRSALRLAYPAWQRVFNVGFRVACTTE